MNTAMSMYDLDEKITNLVKNASRKGMRVTITVT
jgi:hypothetical protein